MIRKFLRGRGVRKFVRNKFAMAALFVIALYLGVALAATFGGLITNEDCDKRWGPNLLQASFAQPSLAERFGYTDWYVEVADTAMREYDRKPERARVALESVDFFGLKPRSTDPDVFVEFMDEVLDDYDELYEEFEELEDYEAEEGLSAAQADAELDSLTMDVAERFGPLESKIMGLLTLEEEQRQKREFALLLGTDRQGRSISLRGLYAIKVAIQIGLISALVSVLIGSLLGGLAGFFGGWVDSMIVWLYSTFSAIPYIVLLMVLAFMFQGSDYEGTLIPVYVAFCSTFWIAPCRVIRGEVMKLREAEYVQAATAMGFGRLYILVKHILPNTTHLMFINFSLMFIGAIKAEVILSFLGLGVKNEPSWGVMINHAKTEVLTGFMWQIGTATVLMFCLVYAFNILSDALQDAFDPKHV